MKFILLVLFIILLNLQPVLAQNNERKSEQEPSSPSLAEGSSENPEEVVSSVPNDEDVPKIKELQKKGVKGRKKVKLIRQNKFILAGGMTYFDNKQTRSDSTDPFLFKSFTGPSIFLQLEKNLSANWDMMLSLKHAPGKVTSGDTMAVDNPAYYWDTYTLDFQYTRPGWIGVVQNRLIEFSLIGGTAVNIIPILTLSGSNTAFMDYVSMNMMNLGFNLSHQFTSRWYYEMFMRYDHPMSISRMKVSNPFIFDGSLGLVYRISKSVDLGWFWYGQYQTYEYAHEEPKVSSIATGKQTLLYSTMDIRLIFKF